MRWLWFGILCCSCLLLMSAADYYARVPDKSHVYTDLATLSRAGYLGGWQKPHYSLLRLEVALLLQTGLPDYYAAQEHGRINVDTDAAVQRLTREFRDELAGLNVQLPGVTPHEENVTGDPDNPANLAVTDTPVELLRPADIIPPAKHHGGPPAVKVQDEVKTDAGSEPLPGRGKPPTWHKPTPVKPAPRQAEAPNEVAMPVERAEGAANIATPEEAAAAPPVPEPSLAVTPEPEPEALQEPVPPPVQAVPPPAPRPTPPPVWPAASTNPTDEHDVNLLVMQREQEQGRAAARVETRSPGPVGEIAPAPVPRRLWGGADQRLALDVRPYADLQGQVFWRRTEGVGASDRATDFRLYWGDAGLRFNSERWSGQLGLNYNDHAGRGKLHELWGQYTTTTGFYARAGRSVLPFADRKGWFPTFSAARELGFTTANTAGIGWDQPGWGVSAWVYDAPVDTGGGASSSLRDFAANFSLCNACTGDDDSGGWRLALAYMSNITGQERKLSAAAQASRVPGLNASGGYSFGHGRYELDADYTAALQRYSAAGLDANGDGQGDQPSALSLELLYTPQGMAFWGLRYQNTEHFTGQPTARWSALYGEWLDERILGRLELSRGSYNGYTPGRRHDLSFVADLNFVY